MGTGGGLSKLGRSGVHVRWEGLEMFGIRGHAGESQVVGTKTDEGAGILVLGSPGSGPRQTLGQKIGRVPGFSCTFGNCFQYSSFRSSLFRLSLKPII